MNTRARRVTRITLIVLALLVLLFAVLGYAVLPGVVDRNLPRWIEERLGMQTLIGGTSLDPLRLRLNLTDLQLSEPGREATATAAHVHVDLAWASLVTPGWTLANLRIDGLDLRVERRPDGTLHNPLRREAGPVTAQDSQRTGAPDVQIRAATLTNARVTYIDHAVAGSPAIVITQVEAGLEEVGTGSGGAGRYRLTARLPDNTELRANGTVSPDALASDGQLRVVGLHTATLWPFLHDQTNLEPLQSSLDFESGYRISQDGDAISLVLEPFTLRVADLDLTLESGGPPLLAARSFEIVSGHFDARQRRLAGDVTIADGALNIEIDDVGSNWGRMFGGENADNEPGLPWHLLARTLRLDGMSFAYVTRSEAAPFAVAIEEARGAGSLEIQTGQSPLALRISDANLQLARLTAVGRDRDVTESIASAQIEAGYLDIAARTFGAANLIAQAADFTLVRYRDGLFGSPLFTDPLTAPQHGPPVVAGEHPQTAGLPDDERPWRFGFAQAAIENGRITYRDQSRDRPRSIAIEPVQARFENLGALAPEPGQYSVIAGLPGDAGMEASGTVSLGPLVSAGHARVSRLDAAVLWPFIEDRLDIAPPQGRFDIATGYRLATGADGLQVAFGPFDLQVADLRLAPPQGGMPHLTARTAAVTGGELDLAQGRLVLPEVTLAQGHLTVAIDANGESNWGNILADAGRADEPGSSWHLLLRRLQFEQMSIAYFDAGEDPIVLRVDDTAGAATLELQTGQTPSRLRVTDAELQLAGLSATGPLQQEPEQIEAAQVVGGFVDMRARTIGASSLTLSGASVSLVRFESGEMGSALLGDRVANGARAASTPDRVARPASDQRIGSAPGRITAPDQAEDPPWRYGFDRIAMERARIRYIDRGVSPPTALVIEPVAVQMENLGDLTPQPGRYQLRAGLPQQGSAHAQGTLQLDPLQSSGTFEVKNVAAAVAWPFLREQLRIAEPRGRLAASGNYRVASADAGVAAGSEGLAFAIGSLALQAEGLRIAEAGAQAPLMEMQRLTLRDGSIDSQARRIALPQVTLSRGMVVIESAADDTLNWTRIVADDDAPAPAGATRARPPQRPWQASVGRGQLDQVAVRYVDHVDAQTVAIEAAVTGSASIEVNAGPAREGFVVSDANADLARITMARPGTTDPGQIDSASITNGFVDTQARAIGANEAAVRGGELAIVRDAQGRLRAGGLGILGDTDAPDTGDGPGWQVRLGAGSIEGLQLSFSDRSFDTPITYEGVLSARVRSVDPQAPAPLEFDASLDLGTGKGVARANGTVTQDFSAARASIRVAGLDFSGLQPLVGRYATLDLRSGQLAVDALLVYDTNQVPTFRAQGQFEITNVLVDEDESDERFLAWRSLLADNFTLDFGPGQLLIEQMRLTELGARIHIAKDGTLNLPSVVRPGEAAAEEPAGAAPTDAGGFRVRIDRVDLRDGAIDFSDQSLILPFAAAIAGVHGTIIGISTEKDNEAVLKGEGRIEPFGMANVVGRMFPFRPREFTDIRVSIENVAMPILSPYTANFAGRTIRSGRLWLDLAYTIVDDELDGDNRILIRNLQLGERVATPDALDLPIELAIALLTDEQGQISIEVPVSGQIGDPKFDYGSLIREAITSTIGRVVTAPFRALARLAGRDRDDDADALGGIAFEPGQDRLLPQQQEQLSTIAVAMARRPTLSLQVRGVYEPQRDAMALRELRARRAVVEATGAELLPDEPPGPLAFDQPRMREAVEAVLAQREGLEAIRRIHEQHGARTAQNPDAVPMAMYERLIETEPFDENQLRLLAVRRAQQIRQYMTATQGVDPKRIQVGQIGTVPRDAPAVVAPLALAAAGS